MKILITGSTGMVGKGVLLECLDDSKVDDVIVINRNKLDLEHPKLKEIIHRDFYDITSLKDSLADLNAVFFCLGISSLGLSEEKYAHVTFNIVKHFVDVIHSINPNIVFNYVTGTGTDSSEKGRIMWARIKGKTENYILSKNFKDAYMFRPGAIIPERGIKSKTNWYSIIYVLLKPFYPLMKRSRNITTTVKIGRAMLNSITINQPKKHLENADINLLATSFRRF